MPAIKILPEHVANKIAAGEVVERPASVVKELLENAIDAGAAHITIETQAGGVGLIRISDDGCGMSREDALLALERHATSKISSVEDITAVGTLGFRGEALPSIASVCRFELITKERTAPHASAIRVEGGKVESVKDATHQDGTTVIVRDLFFNIPARRKFLKSHTTENSHIAQTIRLAVLSRRETGFRWICDGEELISVPAGASLADRIAALFDPEIAEGLVPVAKKFGLLEVNGYAGKPALNRASRTYQIFFVNGRPVQNRTLSFSLKEAYHSLIMVERHPACFIFISLPPSDVDVNVHPSKREVRFRQDALVRDALIHAVREAIGGTDDVQFIAPGETRHERVQEAIARYEVAQSQSNAVPFVPAAVEGEHLFAQGGETGVGQMGPGVGAGAADFPAMESVAKDLSLRLAGQVHNLYLLLESSEGLVILDQHAAHERVLYDQVLGKLRQEQPVESQKLLLPVTIACDPSQAMLLEQCLPDLNKMGMEMHVCGNRAFMVDAIPFFVKTSDIKSLVQDVLEDLVGEERVLAVEKSREEKILLTLCRKAVRAADSLNAREQQALVDQLMACKNPFHCPHGRPTMIKISADYLARQFKR